MDYFGSFCIGGPNDARRQELAKKIGIQIFREECGWSYRRDQYIEVPVNGEPRYLIPREGSKALLSNFEKAKTRFGATRE